jgi:hypothetical protein
VVTGGKGLRIEIPMMTCLTFSTGTLCRTQIFHSVISEFWERTLTSSAQYCGLTCEPRGVIKTRYFSVMPSSFAIHRFNSGRLKRLDNFMEEPTS